MISTRIVCGPFVGRAEELAHLMLRRRQAGDRHGGLVLIGGEPGIGKSRLVGEFTERLNRHTSIVAANACREFAQRPLGPILEILEKIARIRASDLTFSSKSDWLDMIADAFECFAAKRTTVVVIEDLQWADVDLVQTLLVLVRRAANKRLVFVATYRDNELGPTHPLFKWFGQLLREPAVSAISLQRFENRELERLMAHATEGNASLSPPLLRAVRDRSDGNPLFAEELLRSAIDAQRVGPGASPAALPMSLHALMAERLQECSNEERSLLRRASLFGRNFTVAQTCNIAGGALQQLQPALERLCELQMLDAVDPTHGVYRFRHALTRDVIYGEIPLEELSSLHLRIAEQLERSDSAAAAPEAAGHHFWEAGRRERAAAYYERAGDAAMEVFAYDDAAAFYQRATSGFEHDGVAGARACTGAARALIFAGDLDAGLAVYERGVRLALELGDIPDVVRSRALMAGHLFDGGRHDEAIALIRETLPVAQRGEARLSSRLQTRLAMTLARDARSEEAWQALQEIEAAALDPQADSTGEYYLCASELNALRGEADEWRACFARGIAIYKALGHPGPLQIAHANYAVQALYLGETELARAHHRIAGKLARALHFDDQAILQAQVELYAGNLTEARRIVEAMAMPTRFLMRAVLAQVAVPLAIALGDDRMLEAYFDESLVAQSGAFTATHARVTAAHAVALAATNRRAEARALLVRVLGWIKTTFGMTLPIVALATLLPGRAAELRPLLEAAAKPKHDRVNAALLALLEASVAAWRGDAQIAKTCAVDGGRRFAAIGWPLLEARCLEIAGERGAARAIYRRCGAVGELRRLEFSSAAAEGAPLGILTPRERELALQIASGKANRVVAESLSIGEKTVEKYLTSIYAKLGLSSRAQLAALVAAAQRHAD